ncbi:Protein FRM-1 d [Aphelenchoides avenae]|nr:Protein FRM-1 d [Aphelenchus avenae]
MDVVLQKERQVVFECEVFLSAKTRYFSPIFGRKRGPAFLPKSLLEDVAAETEFAAREPRGIGERRAREVADVRLSARAKNASKAGTKLKGPDETRAESRERVESLLLPAIPTSSGSKEASSLNFDYTPSTSSMDNRTESQKQTEANGAGAAEAEHPSFLTSIKRRLSQHIGKEKKEKKRDKKEKKDKKDKKKKDKKKKKKGKDVSSSSSSSSDASDVEVEERHIEVAAPVHEEERRKLTAHILTTAPIETPLESPDDAEGKENVERSAGPYTPPLEARHGPVIREEKVEQVYRIVGTGKNVPKIDPKDPSLDKVVASLERNGEAPLTVKMAEKHVVVREKAPVPTEIREASLPHTTVHTWHETSAGPETVTTEVDEHGNTIIRTVKSQQVKHTIQKQSYQTYEVDENNPTAIGTVERSHEILTPIGEKASSRSPVLETHTRTVAYENGDDYLNANASDVPGELISSKAVTTGNRTVETLTYKIEKDGVIETRVEHRVTIHGGDDIDHDAELSRAILEATKMNPEMTVEKIEVKQETQG